MNVLDIHVGRPIHRGALSLFPCWNGRAVSTTGYVLAPGVVEVAEREGAPVVGQLVVTNPGPEPALVLEGSLLAGGHQDRAANRSVLVPAGQADVIEVSCVQQGRWGGTSTHRALRGRAPMQVRAALRRDQGEVWRTVHGFGDRFGHDGTGSLRYAAGQAQKRAAELVDDLRPLPAQSGVLIGLSGQPLMLELADSPRTFWRLFRPLVRAAALDALHAPSDEPTPGRRARRFVERLQAAELIAGEQAGAGAAITSRSQYVDVRGLLWQDRAVHTVALNPRHELVTA